MARLGILRGDQRCIVIEEKDGICFCVVPRAWASDALLANFASDSYLLFAQRPIADVALGDEVEVELRMEMWIESNRRVSLVGLRVDDEVFAVGHQRPFLWAWGEDDDEAGGYLHTGQ